MAKPEKPDILDVLKNATAEDLESVRAKIAALNKDLAGLQAVEKVLDVQIYGKKERKKPERKAAPASNGTSTNGHTTPVLEGKRQRVADYLRANGAKTMAKLSEATGISRSGPGCLGVVLDDRRFQVEGELVRLCDLKGGL